MKSKIDKDISEFLKSAERYYDHWHSDRAPIPFNILHYGKNNAVFSKNDFIAALKELLYEEIRPENVFFNTLGNGKWCYKSVRYPDLTIVYDFYESSCPNKYSMKYKYKTSIEYDVTFSLYGHSRIETNLTLKFDRNFEFLAISLMCRKEYTSNPYHFVKFKNPKKVDWAYFCEYWNQAVKAAEEYKSGSKYFD